MKAKIILMFLALILTQTVSAEDDNLTLDAAIGGAVGGAIGGAVGAEIGDREGAIIGAGVGAAVGVAINTSDSSSDNDEHRHSQETVYHDHSHPKSKFCPPGQAKKDRC